MVKANNLNDSIATLLLNINVNKVKVTNQDVNLNRVNPSL